MSRGDLTIRKSTVSFASTLTPQELYQRRSAVLVWLHALTLTPLPAGAADDGAFDFVAHLRNGVLLCQAMKTLSEFRSVFLSFFFLFSFVCCG